MNLQNITDWGYISHDKYMRLVATISSQWHVIRDVITLISIVGPIFIVKQHYELTHSV